MVRPIMLDSTPRQVADIEWRYYKEELGRRQTLKKAEEALYTKSHLSSSSPAEIAWKKKVAARPPFVL